uniref:Uncharacterized protein n=1 Tax=Trichogramma kaykai TaxID=54128 RepID=A0ABD2WZA9_9HYME
MTMVHPLVPDPRACITVKGMNAILMPTWCRKALAVIKTKLREEGRGSRKVVVASAYFPCDSQNPPPTAEAQGLIQHCQKARLMLIIGCNANLYHTAWGALTSTAGAKHC